jgi:hypothetical protein
MKKIKAKKIKKEEPLTFRGVPIVCDKNLKSGEIIVITKDGRRIRI